MKRRMRMTNRFLIMCLVFVMAFGMSMPFSVFADGDVRALDDSIRYKDGSYTGSAQGYGGIVNVTVTVAGGRVTGVAIGENSETGNRLSLAMDMIPNIIANNGTQGVDAVSRATVTSNAIKAAVNEALAKAVDSGVFASGAGTAQSPYVIETADQLKAFRDAVNGGETYANAYIKLNANVDISAEQWTPIGGSAADAPKFSGNFDGDGHRITGLTIGSAGAPAELRSAGLFASLGNTARISNLTLADVSVYSTYGDRGWAGALAGQTASGSAAAGGTVIDNCAVVGGVVNGRTTVGQISYAGGLIGQINADTAITNSHTDVAVYAQAGGTQTPYAGGIAAVAGTRCLIVNSYALGDVTIVSSNMNLTGLYAGGLVGMQSGYVYNCYARGAITATSSPSGATAYTGVGAIDGWLLVTGAGMDTVFYNSGTIITVNGVRVNPVKAAGAGVSTATAEPTNATALDAGEMASAEFAGMLNRGIKNLAEAPFAINLPAGVELQGWQMEGGAVSHTGEAWVETEIDDDVFAGGDGTQENPYLIATKGQLMAFATSLTEEIDYAQKYVAITQDIDLEGETWTPIGEGEYVFAGVIDGRGHTISNLTWRSDTDPPKDASEALYIGFVGVLSGTVRNLNLKDVDIHAVGSVSVYAGAVAAYTYLDAALIDGCTVTGEIYCESVQRGNNFAGGVTGTLYRGYIVNTGTDVKVTSVQGGEYWAEAGGIAPINNRGYVLNCYALGDVRAEADRALEAGITAGNLVGMQAGVMANSYATGNLSTSDWAQDIGAVAGNTTGIGKGYYQYYNTGAHQQVGSQVLNPAIGIGVTTKTIDEDDGVTVLAGFNYDTRGFAADYFASAELVQLLNSNLGAFPLELPQGVTLRNWVMEGGSVKLGTEAANVIYKEIVVIDDTPPAFFAGEYMGRDAGKTTAVRIAVTEDALTNVVLVSPTSVNGSDALIAEIKSNPNMVNAIEVEGTALKALREAIATALEKAKIGDRSGYGAADPAIFESGAGTESDPWTIKTEAQLRAWAASINEDESYEGKYIELSNDIALESEWIPTAGGNAPHSFSGVFDGKDHTIGNLTIGTESVASDYRFAGFFGYLNGAKIKNLHFENVSIVNVYTGQDRHFAAAVAAGIDGMTYIDNCSAQGEIKSATTGTGANFIGGISGFTSGSGNVAQGTGYSAFITNCFTDVDLHASAAGGWVYAGGLIGSTNRTYIVNCFTLGDVVGQSGVPNAYNLNRVATGGIAGFNGGYVTNVYTKGNMQSVSPSTDVGGFAGRHTGIATADYIYYNADATHYSAGLLIEPTPFCGVVVGGSAVNELVAKSDAELSSEAFATELSNNVKNIDIALLSDVAWRTWIFDAETQSVAFGAFAGGGGTVDKSDLQELYNALNEAVESEELKPGAYTAKTWTAFIEALAYIASLLADDDALQIEVDIAEDVLAKAYATLSVRPFLRLLMNEVEDVLDIVGAAGYETAYQADKRVALETALANAQEAINTPGDFTDAGILSRWSALQGAVKNLNTPADSYKDELAWYIAFAENMLDAANVGKYIPAAAANLEAVIDAAKAVLADAGATTDEVRAETAKLETAIQQMYVKGDKADLQALYDRLSAYDEDDYTPVSWANFEDALENAEQVLQNVNTIEDDVQAAIDDLIAADAALELKNMIDFTALRASVDKGQAILDARADYIMSTITGLPSLVASGNQLLTMPGATQAQVNAANNALRAAIANARLKPDKSPLLAALNAASPLNFSLYTDSSVQALSALINEAQNLLARPDNDFYGSAGSSDDIKTINDGIKAFANKILSAIAELAVKPSAGTSIAPPAAPIAPILSGTRSAAGTGSAGTGSIVDDAILADASVLGGGSVADGSINDAISDQSPIADNAVPQAAGSADDGATSAWWMALAAAALLLLIAAAMFAYRRREKEGKSM